MTDEQINIAIAESLGFMRDKIADYWRKDGACFFIEDPHHLRQLPNYTADLNACHEFEKMLDDELDLDYSQNLESVTGTRWSANNSYDMSKYRSATARQRCEAYLRTIGKWIE